MVETGKQRCVAGYVVALLVIGEATAHHHVGGLAEVDFRVALDERAQRDRGEIVRAFVPQCSSDRLADRRADCIDNDCLRHGSSLRDPTEDRDDGL